MEVVYQMYRTILYKQEEDERFKKLDEDVLMFYDNNEVMSKMKRFREFKKSKKVKLPKEKLVKKIQKPTLLNGDCRETLKSIDDASVNLIFTSPPYYNARSYSDYHSYREYLSQMKEVLHECNRVLEDGRFILINISPVITKRPGREFESIRYPIHYDFHELLTQCNFYFIDEIIWIKPESSVPNRNGGYMQTRLPLSYKPNCITESIMVYRKKCDFLIDENIKKYSTDIDLDQEDKYETSNCWYISPKSTKEHPAVFPSELCERVLKFYSFENDIVLDPFAGSGTLGETAKMMNRIPILCEQNHDYIRNLMMKGYDLINKN
jgi:DNA modification methylase